MSALLGKDDVLFIHNGTTYLPIGCLTSNSININRDMTEGTLTKCNTNPEPVPGRVSYDVSFEAVADTDETTKIAFDALQGQIESGDISYWKTQRGGSDHRFGKGYFTSLNESAPVEGEITWGATIQGVGNPTDSDQYTTTTTTL